MPIINGNKKDRTLLPMSYLWAHNYYRKSITQRWLPEQASMQIDIEQWRSSSILTTDERTMILFTVGFFAAANTTIIDNLMLSTYKHITNPECRQYIVAQASEKALHAQSLIYLCDTLGLDHDYIFSLPQTMNTLKSKLSLVQKHSGHARHDNFTPVSTKNIQQLLTNLVSHYIILQGIFVTVGFMLMLALKRRNKMDGMGEQWEYIMRDESMQISFGSNVIKEIAIENKGVWTPAFKDSITNLIKEAVTLEKEYIKKTCPHGTLGIDAAVLDRFIEYVADKRLEEIGLSKVYQQVNPFKWISSSLNGDHSNPFEKETNDYHSGSINV